VVEKPVPEPGPEEAVVRSTAALICTSDVHTVRGALPVEPDRTLGHESVGVIHSLGSAVSGFTEGQRVTVSCSAGTVTTVSSGDLRGTPQRVRVASQCSMPARPSGTKGQLCGSASTSRSSSRVTQRPSTISSGCSRSGPSQRTS
jgi:NADPH:quinone reductase-like Zn-dependent oxidoreductase